MIRRGYVRDEEGVWWSVKGLSSISVEPDVDDYEKTKEVYFWDICGEYTDEEDMVLKSIYISRGFDDMGSAQGYLDKMMEEAT